MPTAAELKRSEKLRCLVYGRFGLGKTEGAATFPRPNFISFDRGSITLASPGFAARHPKVKLDEIYTQNFYERDLDRRGVVAKHNAFDDACMYFDAWMNPKGQKWTSPYPEDKGYTYDCHPDKFDTWVIDSGTTMVKAVSNKAIMLMSDKAFAGEKLLSWTYLRAKQFGMIVLKQQDFGAERSMTEQFIEQCYNSGKNFVLICHEKEEWEGVGENARMVGTIPLLTGQSVDRVCALFDEVYRLTSVPEGPGVKRFLETKLSGSAKTKSRLEVPPGTAWDYDALIAAINSTTKQT